MINRSRHDDSRKKGSGSEGLVLYNAPDWRERVHIMDRDCALSLQVVDGPDAIRKIEGGLIHYEDAGTTFTGGVGSRPSSQPGEAETIISNSAVGGGSVTSMAWDPDLGCSPSRNARSVVRSDSLLGYKESNYFRSILMPGQPFALSGDVTLTTRRDSSGKYFVSIDRLYGNEVCPFLHHLPFSSFSC